MVKKQPENDASIFSMGMGSQMGVNSQMVEKVIMLPPETIKDYSPEKGISLFMKGEINLLDLSVFTMNNKVSEGESITITLSNSQKIIIKPLKDIKPLQAFDSKIFDAILKLATDQNRRIIITDLSELARTAGVDPRKSKDIKDALYRLRYCACDFYNVFYSAITGKIRPGNNSFNLLSSFFVGPKEDLQTDELTQDEKGLCQSVFFKKQAKIFIILRLADEIYDNLHDESNRGWLLVNYDILRSFKDKNETAARFLYKILFKWGGNENRKNPHWNNKLLLSGRFIAARLGLDWGKSANVSKTLSSIKKAADILKKKVINKEKGVLIEDFKIPPTKPLSESVIEFHFKPGVFDKNKAIEDKQQTIFDVIEQNADSQTKQRGKNSKAAAGGFSPVVENLFSDIPKKERLENPEKEVKNEINKALQSGKDADYIRLCIYYAVLRQQKGFFKAFKAAIKDNLVEKENENPEKLKAQFQKLLEKREQEAAKEAEKEKLNKRFNEIVKQRNELKAAFDAEIAEIEKTADSPEKAEKAKQAAGKDPKTAICKMWSLADELEEIHVALDRLN